MERQRLIISDDIVRSLGEAMAECDFDRLFVLADETTARLCLPVACRQRAVKEAPLTSGRSLDASGPRATRCW